VDDVPEQALEALYAVPLRDFTRERNARAAALAKAGNATAAEAVKALRRPPAWLWVTNQLGRLEGKHLAAFLEAASRLHATQLRDPQAAGATAQQHRAHLGTLLQRARDVLRREGHRVTPALERRISNTLLGAAADGRLADDLRHGRLTSGVQAPGFDALLGAPGAGRRPPAKLTGKRVPPAPTASTSKAQVVEERTRLRARALADEAAAREAAARRLESEIAAATTALAEQQRRLRNARRDARRAAEAARKAGKPER
jgi:hypothetical protein